MDETMDPDIAYLKEVYHNPELSVSFGSPQTVYKYAKENGHHIPLKKIKHWLSQDEVYTSHRKVVRKFKRPRVIANKKYVYIATDTANISRFKKSNDGFAYILVLVDILSRFMYTTALKSLKGAEVKSVLENLLPKGCKYIWSDGGTEYHNKEVKPYLKSRKIKLYTTGHETKSSMAERAIKTLKSRIFKYFSHKQTHKWYTVLETVTKAYNSSYHRIIKCSPNEAIAMSDSDLWRRQYIDTKINLDVKKFKFNVGDQVKISILGDKFSRGFDYNWTGEYFQIISRKYSQGIPMYNIKSYDNEEIRGSFFEEELQKTNFNNDHEFKIEKIIRRRKRQGVKEVLVKWFLWPEKYNSWIAESELRNISTSE